MIGRTLGSYRILEKLGAGGMGDVYRARDTKLERDVAIKLLSADVAQSRERLERLQREARLLASIDHPNINAIYAVEEVDGFHFLVLQLVMGTTLSARLREGQIPVKDALSIGAQIAEALGAAHAKAIVHRDLKPSNVMIAPDGRVKVLDFGIAKATRPPAADDTTMDATRSELTQRGSVIGTAPYMSPEQLRGAAVDNRTDIWAFGCLLYEMFTGQRAFGGDTVADTGAAIIGGEPEWRHLPVDVPATMRQLVRCCLTKASEGRLADISLAKTAIRDVLTAGGPARQVGTTEGRTMGSHAETAVATAREALEQAPTRVRTPRSRRRFVPVAIAALILIGIFVSDFVSDRTPSLPADRPLQLANQLLATSPPGSHRAPTLSPDGSTMAFVSDASGLPRIWVQTVAEGASPISVTDEEAPALHPSWSPTDSVIAFHRPGDGIWTVGSLGSPPPRRIVEQGTNPRFSWDGSQIVYERELQIWIANADGTDQRAIDGSDVLMPTAVQYSAPAYPAISPDGQSVVYFRNASGPMGDLWVVPASGGAPRRLTFDTNQMGHPIWTPDGQHVVFSSMRSGSRTLWRVPASGGTPEAVTSGAGEDSQPAISRDGRRLAYSNARNERALMVYDPEAGESREVLVRRYGLVVPRFSPDGESIAFFGEVAGGTEVSVVGADGQTIRQVTEGDGQLNIHPRWAPDGETLYFYRDYPYREESPGEFLRVSVEGGVGQVVLPDFYWDRNMFAELHPSDPRVAYVRVERPYPYVGPLVVRDLRSGEEHVFPTPDEWDSDPPLRLFLPRWSHDGRHIVAMDLGFAFRDDERNRVWVCAVEGACRSVLDGIWPVWSGDDAHIYFAKLISGYDEVEIWIADRDGQNERLVTSIGPLNPISAWYDVAPDGRIVWVQDRPGRPEIWSAEIVQH